MTDQQMLEKVASSYRNDGYEVVVRPSREHLPDFLAQLPVDLLARKEGKHVVAAVRRSFANVRGDSSLVALGRAVEAVPGWQIDLHVVEPQRTPLLTLDAAEPDLDLLHRWLERAEEGTQGADLLPSCVLACSALDAAVRRTVRELGGVVENVGVEELITRLRDEDILEYDDWHFAIDAMRLRDTIGRGYTTNTPKPAIVQGIVALARRLLAYKATNGISDSPEPATQEVPAGAS